MKVVAIVGMSGSGKSEVTRVFEQNGFVCIRFGDLTDREVTRRGLTLNEENERQVREQIRKEHGMGAYARLNLTAIDKALQNSNVVVDGLYSWEEYKLLKDYYDDKLLVMSVYSSPKTRQRRISQRQARPLSSQDALSRDFAEIENLNKGGPIAMADFTLINESTLEELRKEAEQLVNTVANK